MPLIRRILDDLARNGLPAWVYTWRTVVVIAVLGPFVVMALSSLLGSAWALVMGPSRHAPDCYTVNAGGHLIPGTELLNLGHHRVEALGKTRDTTIEAVAHAIDSCRPDSCGAAERQAFQKAAVAYMVGRGQAAQHMFVQYGYAGLAYGEQLYDTDDDRAVTKRLRQGFDAGLLDISRLHGNEQVVRIQLFRPFDAFKLCVAPEGTVCPGGRFWC